MLYLDSIRSSAHMFFGKVIPFCMIVKICAYFPFKPQHKKSYKGKTMTYPIFGWKKVWKQTFYSTKNSITKRVLLRILFKIWFFGVLNMMKAKVVVFECIFNEIQDRQFALKTGFLGFQVP